MEIPDDVRNKIKFLCKNISSSEWSGVLFYIIEGSIRNISTAKIVLKDIFLMDRGSKVYTSFDWDEDIVEYRMNNPESIDWLVGHIHSHNTMDVFFSGTDWSELNDNCPHHNFYLSVIVNNYLEIDSKIAFTGETKVFSCKDETGADYNLNLVESTLEPFMFVYSCELVSPIAEQIEVPEDFSNRIKIVEEKSKLKAEEVAKRIKEENKLQQVQQDYKQRSFLPERSRFPDYTPKNNYFSAEEEDIRSYFMEGGEFMDGFSIKSTDEMDFAIYVLKLGEPEIDDDLMSVLEEIDSQELNPQSFAISISETYGALYERFFEKRSNKYNEDKEFIEVLNKVIDTYSEYTIDYKFLKTVIHKLKEIRNKYAKYLKENNAKQKHTR